MPPPVESRPDRKGAGWTWTGPRLFLLAILFTLFGCNATSVIDESRVEPTAITGKDAVVVLGRRARSNHPTESDFVSCVGKDLASGKNPINVIPEEKFVNSMYPYFETSTAPTDVKNLQNIVRIPVVAKKFAAFHVRYFVWIDGHTETTGKKGTMSCAIGPGGGGCFGFMMWSDKANYEASIWDFKDLKLSGKISDETHGTSYLPAVVVPIPLLARVQSHACDNMAKQIKHFLE